MKSCSQKTSSKLSDVTLSTYVAELEKTHTELYNKFLSLL